MSPLQREEINKRRRDKRAAKRLFKMPEEKKETVRQAKANYKKLIKEQRENNLHPDSIAMANPQWKPELLFPPGDKPTSRVSEQLVIPDFGGSPVYVGLKYGNLHSKMKSRRHFCPTLSIQPT
jgi:hypothetical protein